MKVARGQPLTIDSARAHGTPDADIIRAFNRPARYRELHEGPDIIHEMRARRMYLR